MYYIHNAVRTLKHAFVYAWGDWLTTHTCQGNSVDVRNSEVTLPKCCLQAIPAHGYLRNPSGMHQGTISFSFPVMTLIHQHLCVYARRQLVAAAVN